MGAHNRTMGESCFASNLSLGSGLAVLKSMSEDFRIEAGPRGTNITMTKRLG